MKFNKKVIGSMTVLSSLCVMTTVAAMTNNGERTLADHNKKVVTVAYTESSRGRAGFGAEIARTSVEADSVKKATIKEVGYEAIGEQIEGLVKELKLSDEEKDWASALMPKVEDFLLVRTEANQDSQVVGKLYKGNKATVVEKGEEWTKISSGNLQGYVRNDMCYFGLEALNYAKQSCQIVAVSKTEGLRVRASQDANAEVTKVLSNGEGISVDTNAQANNEWVAVKVNDATNFVSRQFVDVKINTGVGVTLEEEAAAKAAEEAKKAQEAQSAKEAQEAQSVKETQTTKSAPARTTGSSLAASANDVTLLAALIQCEAGGESYECQLAVGAVVVNRVQSGYADGTLYGVIYQRGQFGPAMTGKLERVLSKGPSSTSVRAAQEALSGVDNVGGVKNFRDVSSSSYSGHVIGGMVFF
ncbi:cell wall hydrolase [Lachnobacterium bovis]|uniref:cell wall hydrolase n=1 Tax=Lachnobacterium bovis TaxID=140626 RepID=UPI0003B45BA7|nr:cell wall hydrolase [Lachnobacterium bovis]